MTRRAPSRPVATEPIDQVHFFFGDHSDQTIRIVADFDRHVDEGALSDALAAAVADAPVLGLRYEERRGRALWVDVDPETADAVVAIDAVPADEVTARVAHRLVERVTPFDAPALRARIVRHPGGDVVCFSIDHSHTDGGGFKLAVQHVLATYAARVAGAPRPSSPWNTTRRDVALAVSALRLRTRLRLLGAIAQPAPRPWTFQWDSGSAARRAAFVATSVDRHRVEALRAYARAHSATLNDVMLAAFFRALVGAADGSDGAQPMVDVPVDLRKHVPGERRIGPANMTGVIRCALAGGVGRTFGESLARVKAAMDEAKRAQVAFGVVVPLVVFRPLLSYRALGNRVRAQPTRFAPFFSNMGAMDVASVRDAGVRSLCFVGSVSLGGPLSVQACTVDGALHLASGAYGTARDHARVASLLARIRAELEGCAASDDAPPSALLGASSLGAGSSFERGTRPL